MAEMDILKLAVQFGEAGLFLWLFLRLDERLVKMNERHDAEMRTIHQQRVNELKWLAKIPTDLEGNYRVGPDSTVRA